MSDCVFAGSALLSLYFFFFFQAEDGIRDLTVTGVQTCALPILIAGDLVVDEGVIVEGLEPKLIGEHESVREVAEDHLVGMNGSGADAVHALRADRKSVV